jgi:hypothetical protein
LSAPLASPFRAPISTISFASTAFPERRKIFSKKILARASGGITFEWIIVKIGDQEDTKRRFRKGD